MRKTLLFTGVFLSLGLAGCSQAPPTSHGKPIAYWVEKVKDGDPKTRLKAVKALGHVGTADPAAVPALIEAVRDKDAEVRAAAIVALIPLGADAKGAVPALEQARNDPSPKVRLYAAKALEKVQGP
jgi:hypothetical protein